MNWDAVNAALNHWARTFPGPVPTIDELNAAANKDVDQETLAIMSGYAGRDLWDRGDVEHIVARIDPDIWSLSDFEDLLSGFLDAVPEARRESARVELCGGYEESTYLKISYVAPETDESRLIRIGHALMEAMKKKANDIATFERLKAKFATSQ